MNPLSLPLVIFFNLSSHPSGLWTITVKLLNYVTSESSSLHLDSYRLDSYHLYSYQ